METQNQNSNTSLWITSLAISVTCCAVLFVVFAGYLTSINKSIANENMQLSQMAVHEGQLLTEIEQLRHTIVANQQVAPSAPAAAPVSTGPVTTAPAPASPAAIPEIPAKK